MLLVYLDKKEEMRLIKFNGIKEFLTKSRDNDFSELNTSDSIVCITKDFTLQDKLSFNDLYTTLLSYVRTNRTYSDNNNRHFQSLDWWLDRLREVKHNSLPEPGSRDGVLLNKILLEMDLYDVLVDTTTDTEARRLLLEAVQQLSMEDSLC